MVNFLNISIIWIFDSIIFGIIVTLFSEQITGTEMPQENIVPFFMIIGCVGFLLMLSAFQFEMYKLHNTNQNY